MKAISLGGLPRRTVLSRDVIIGMLILAEVLFVLGIGIAVYGVYLAPNNADYFGDYLGTTVLYAILLCQLLYISGLYELNRYVALRNYWPKVVSVCWIAFMIMVSVGFLFKNTTDYSRVWAVVSIASVSVLLPVFRIGTTRLLNRFATSGLFSLNIAIFGSGENAARLVELIEKTGEPWNRLVGIYDDRNDRVPSVCAGREIAGNADSLIEHVRKRGCDEVLLAMPLASPERYSELIQKLRSLPSNVRIVPDLSVLSIASSPTSIGLPFGLPMITLLAKPISGWGALCKRLVDFFLTLAILLVALPVMLLVAILIKADSRGPVLFVQKRLGFQNEVINVYKFRTMHVDSADQNAEKLVTRGDPRVTRVGRILRRFSLDELPQLFNVLSGDMSLVGPRPHAFSAKAGGKLYADVTNTYYHRTRMKPGLTGWAQVNGWRGNTETEEDLHNRVEHDLQYIDNWSLGLDFRILLQTIWIVFIGEESY